ncbi:hypothetical protein I7V34_14680 [Bacillus sp. V3]|nr:hypothetical protein I7V34_14680 [Bacillus sp. V3]
MKKSLLISSLMLSCLFMASCGDAYTKEVDPDTSKGNSLANDKVEEKAKDETSGDLPAELLPEDRWTFEQWESASQELKLTKVARVFETEGLPPKANSFYEEVVKVVDENLESA